MPAPAPTTPVAVPPTPAEATCGERARAAIEAQTRAELVRIAFRQLRAGTAVGVVGAIALIALIRDRTSLAAILGWIGFMAVPTGWAFWLARKFESVEPAAADNRRWALGLVAALTLGALGWGLTPWIFPSLAEPGLPLAAHVLLLAAMSAASMRVLLPMRKGSVACLLAIMGPVTLRYLVHPDASLLVLAVFVALFVGHTIWTNQHNHRVLSDAIASRFQREALAAELRAENTRRETREAELREARERAESASKAKGEFLATISHEIRTPMNGVIGMLRIVRDTELTAVQRDYLKTASDSAEALLLLLNDVLDFSEIESNRLDLAHAPFSPAAIARTMADMHHARARDRGLQLDLRLGPDLPSALFGDAARVRQIVINLVSNALKFTERGRIELRVDCTERNAQRATVQFSVSDTGIGIDSATLANLFKPFTQADNSFSRRYGGTGLGLAISHRLTQAMGGTLEVQSTVGQGTTFRLILGGLLPEPAPSAPATGTGAKFVTPKLKGHVLVVEDDTVNQQVIELFLKKLNVSLKIAPNGEMAITYATTEAFDLVLMDCQLPGIDGMEATRRIREKLAGKPLRIVALTANANANIREACLASGMNDFLSKPVRFEQLAQALQRYLPAG
jgi:signal transduction histidine kinase/ActR/RegA family two-component response regulator